MFILSGWRRFACLALLAAPVSPLFAQRDAASLEGRVIDSSGAVIANASVNAVNAATNFNYHVQSDASGEWIISPVRIGTYTITISASGFKQMIGYIDADNTASLAIHEKFGFRRVGLLPGVAYRYGRWADTVMVQRSLASGSTEPPPRSSFGR